MLLADPVPDDPEPDDPVPDDPEPPPTDTGGNAAHVADRAEADAVRALLDRNYHRLELAVAKRHAPV